jgi:hypothetical protein
MGRTLQGVVESTNTTVHTTSRDRATVPINSDKPSKAEIRRVIATLKNGKAAGPDNIPAK